MVDASQVVAIEQEVGESMVQHQQVEDEEDDEMPLNEVQEVNVYPEKHLDTVNHPLVADLDLNNASLIHFEKINIDLKMLMREIKVSNSGQGRLIKKFNEILKSPGYDMHLPFLSVHTIAGPPLLSPYKTNKLVQKHYGVQKDTYDVCENRSHMFYDNKQTGCSCPNNSRYEENGVTPVATITQLPLYKQLATFFNTADRRQQLLYCANWKTSRSNRSYRDIFDGRNYQKNKHLFTSKFDLALALYIDGFFPQKRGSVTMVTFMAVILNLSPDVRYKKENMLQIFIAFGDKNPNNIFNYLAPTFRDLLTLQIKA
ncbi:hypothetical protein A0J61_10811 [Choanephora cucurbitarum]|uniref:Uncharacterized protein n=1 Tax=Choanephora cucurbitarum TaxID=101091 RepID=A0A1C7MWE7_9FUNG|nr:hypothetical protein A0J61_10811 [Choanephora cucurbitarum]